MRTFQTMMPGCKKTKQIICLFGLLLSTPLLSCASPNIKGLSDAELEALHALALEHLDSVQILSFREGVEYCGLFGYDNGHHLIATPPIKGEVDSCTPDNEPEDFIILASYHTHGSYSPDADTEVPSVGDLEGDVEESIYGYVATPGGRVWFNDWEAEEALMLWGKGTLISDPNFRDCPAFLPDKRYNLDELIQRAEEDSGEC